MKNRSSLFLASCAFVFLIMVIAAISTQPSLAVIDCEPRCLEVERQQHEEMDNQLNTTRTELQRGNSTGAIMHFDLINNLINRHACLPDCAPHAGVQQHHHQQ